jgi:S-methylmethionine-dependent homocysteine/selenocysteine methylase
MLSAVQSRRQGSVAILDGGMGTGLGQLGLSEWEAWTAGYRLDDKEIADKVLQVYLEFLRAGVDILTANTYNISATEECFTDLATKWHAEGCAIIGGCCRITAEDIKSLNEKFPRLQKRGTRD